MKKITSYSGAEWVQEAIKYGSIKGPMSELGELVAEILGEVYYGIYHLDSGCLSRVDWANGYWIEIVIGRDMATYDGDTLTRLVILCHELLVRCEIEAAAPRYLRLIFHKRHARDGKMSRRHPTIEDAVASVRASLAEAKLEVAP